MKEISLGDNDVYKDNTSSGCVETYRDTGNLILP